MFYPLPVFLEPELLEPELPLGALLRCPESPLGALIFGEDCVLGSAYPLGLSVFGELVLGSVYVLGFSVFGPLFLGELVLGSSFTSFPLGVVALGEELFLGVPTSLSLVLGVAVVPVLALGSDVISPLVLGDFIVLLLSNSCRLVYPAFLCAKERFGCLDS